MGAWELRALNQVLCGILHTDTTTVAWALSLRGLDLPGPIIPISGQPYDMARNTLCMRAIEGGFKWIFFLDSDVRPPKDAVRKLMSRNLPIVSGVYHRRSPPHGLPVMVKGGGFMQSYPPNRLIEVDLVGAGCLLIRRDVLEKMPPQDPRRGRHWFDWRVDMAGLLPPGEALSEDFSFNLHARRTLGIKTMVDTSVVCGHVGYGEASYGNLLPLDTVPLATVI